MKSNESYSIVIPAYNVEKYIEECLQSCISQKININYEIIVGIDGCKKTLETVKNIKIKFPNIKFYFMKENKGVFVTLNTLIKLSSNENIIIFGADDIMCSNLISSVNEFISNSDIVRFHCENFKMVNEKYIKISKTLPHGGMVLKRKVFEKLGGFKDWICAADTDFLNRIPKEFKTTIIKDILVKRRVHNESLTNNRKTNHQSDIRSKYRKMLSTKFEYIEPKFHAYYSIIL